MYLILTVMTWRLIHSDDVITVYVSYTNSDDMETVFHSDDVITVYVSYTNSDDMETVIHSDNVITVYVSYTNSDDMETVIHSDDAFAQVAYLHFNKMHLEDKNLVMYCILIFIF